MLGHNSCGRICLPNANQREVKSSNEDLQDRIQFFFTNSVAFEVCYHFQSVQTYRGDSNRPHSKKKMLNLRCVVFSKHGTHIYLYVIHYCALCGKLLYKFWLIFPL